MTSKRRTPARPRAHPGAARKQALPALPPLGTFTQLVLAEQARLAPLLPDLDPHDLNLALANLLRPVEERSFFLLPNGDDHAF